MVCGWNWRICVKTASILRLASLFARKQLIISFLILPFSPRNEKLLIRLDRTADCWGSLLVTFGRTTVVSREEGRVPLDLLWRTSQNCILKAITYLTTFFGWGRLLKMFAANTIWLQNDHAHNFILLTRQTLDIRNLHQEHNYFAYPLQFLNSLIGWSEFSWVGKFDEFCLFVEWLECNEPGFQLFGEPLDLFSFFHLLYLILLFLLILLVKNLLSSNERIVQKFCHTIDPVRSNFLDFGKPCLTNNCGVLYSVHFFETLWRTFHFFFFISVDFGKSVLLTRWIAITVWEKKQMIHIIWLVFLINVWTQALIFLVKSLSYFHNNGSSTIHKNIWALEK